MTGTQLFQRVWIAWSTHPQSMYRELSPPCAMSSGLNLQLIPTARHCLHPPACTPLHVSLVRRQRKHCPSLKPYSICQLPVLIVKRVRHEVHLYNDSAFVELLLLAFPTTRAWSGAYKLVVSCSSRFHSLCNDSIFFRLYLPKCHSSNTKTIGPELFSLSVGQTCDFSFGGVEGQDQERDFVVREAL